MLGARQTVLAIDMGSSAIKVLEMGMRRGRPAVQTVGMVSLGATDSDDAKSSDDMHLAGALSQLLANTGIKPKRVRHVVSSLPGPQVGIKQINTLKLAPEELRSSLAFEARKHMPVKGEVLLDYQVLGEQGDHLDVLLVVTTREAVERHHRILSYSGLKAGIIDAPQLAQVNAALLARKERADQVLLCLHMGASTTHVSLRTGTGHFFSRDIAIAGNAFTEEIRREKQIDFADAEKYKCDKGFVRTTASDRDADSGSGIRLALATATTGRTLESYTRELQRSIRFFMKEAGCNGIDTAVVSGGASADPTLGRHLEKELRLSLTPADPFEEGGIATDLLPENRYHYVQAAGLALRGVHDLLPH
jgi:type IV pilus assembly protein PilM